MKILYGVQGTGNGHITRARHMAESLANDESISVDYLFSGRQYNGYFDMQVFNNYTTKRGFTFITERGQVKHAKTILNNNPLEFLKDVTNCDVSKYDLVINDFEPVSAWAARKKGVPSLSISHQAAFLHQVPKKDQGLIDKIITKYFAPTTYSLGTHWYHFGHSIIPPVISKELTSNRHIHSVSKTSQLPILVYLPFESMADIEEQLLILSDEDFVCYHPQVKHHKKVKNISFKPLSNTQFKKDLIASAGVISNCGFELSTECLSLGKPLLVKPLRKQYEQLSNAYTLKQLGLCELIVDLNAEDIDDWLQQKQGVKVDFPTNCDSLVKWIKQGHWQNTDDICATLWKQVHFPNLIKNRLDYLTNGVS